MKKLLSHYEKWELVWIPLSLVLITGCWFLEYFLTPVELRDTAFWQVIYFIATFTGMLCVVLTSGKRWSQWIVGLINITGFILLYWHWQVYGTFLLNLLFYIPASFIGIVCWLKNRDTKYTSTVKNLNKKQRINLSIIAVISLVIIAIPLSMLDKAANEPLTLIGFLDSAGTVLGVIGQILLNLRYSEQWWIWIILDIIMAILNFTIGQYAMGAMYVLWTANAIIGLVIWQKSIKEKAVIQDA